MRGHRIRARGQGIQSQGFKVLIGTLTVLVHAHLHALLEATRLALVAMRLVHHTASCPCLASKEREIGGEGEDEGDDS